MKYQVSSQDYDHDINTTINANNMTHALFIVRKLCDFRYIKIVDNDTPHEENKIYGVIIDDENGFVDETYDGYSHQTVTISKSKAKEGKPSPTINWNKEYSVTDKDEIKALVSTDEVFAVQCLKKLYKYQTDAEQSHGYTSENNNVGFSGADGEILSSFAEQVKKWENSDSKFKSPLSQKQIALLQKKIAKYSKQLSSIFSNKEE